MIALLLLVQNCSSNQALFQNKITVQPRSSWKAVQARLYKSHVLTRITVHHEGTKLLMTDDAAKKINNIQKWGMGHDKQWADIPYHYLIAPGGTIYEGRNPYIVGETSTEYDPTGHLLICCLGNLETDTVPEAQLQSLVQLIKYSTTKYKIPIDSVGTHKDFSRQTTCPGKNLAVYFENGCIKAALQKLK